jgi:3-deoxy-manno-octulosonate cytidylyltransferase (CMP-KDO synthetase)
MKIIAIIPARMSSTRFPGKVLFQLHGLPMLEHVRRRSLLSCIADDIYVATCDEEIAKTVRNYGGKVIMTDDFHLNGTSRVAEAVKSIECTHVILLQGDEPLLLPRHIDNFVKVITANPDVDAWNATGTIDNKEELDRHSFVKCSVSSTGRILYCFRRTPCFSDFEVQKAFIRKMLGIIAYRKDFLLLLSKLSVSYMEEAESIEQMRIIDNGFVLHSLQVTPSLPSVNEPHEVEIVLDCIQNNSEQRKLLTQILF